MHNSIKVETAIDEQNRVTYTLTSTAAMIVVVRGGIVVVSTGTFGGSSSLRLVLYWCKQSHFTTSELHSHGYILYTDIGLNNTLNMHGKKKGNE